MQPEPASNNLLALPDGTELAGDYRIKRVLGAGGFGITYLADEMALARLVTIKEYFPADFAARGSASKAMPRSEEFAVDYDWGLERFIEEAQTLARFVHPNIVRVYRYFRAHNTGYMVLHFEEGGSFKSWLKGLGRAPRQAELDRIVAPLLEALELVHNGDFLHRDIAPDNIIIRKDGSPVLIDFGSARGEIASHSKTVSALVKPGYSPYEQYATTSRQQGPWTDIYALGATLYHAISGKRPPDGPSRMVNDEYVSAAEVALSSYRPAFLAAIDRALKLEVGERPQSIADWRRALLAPEPKRAKGRLSLGRALQGLRTSDATPKPANTNTEPTNEKAQDVVPAPPDAPQPKGQLLDFIDALKKHRAAPAPKKPHSGAADPAPAKPAASANSPAPQAVKSRSPAAEEAPEPQFGIGFGPPPRQQTAASPRAPKAKSASTPEPKSVQQPRAAPAIYRSPARPRRARRFGVPSRQWRSLAVKLAIGLGIAGLAVAYQNSLPKTQGRGASVVSSQTTDLAQPVRMTGHKGAVTAIANADQGRLIVSVGVDGTLRIWSAASGSLVRTIELDEGLATALAVDDRRALTGHKSGAIVLWDLERAEKLAQFQNRESPVASLAFTSDANHFAAANQDGSAALFDVRLPPTPTAGFENQDSTLGVATASQAKVIVTSGNDRIVRLWRTDPYSLARSWRSSSEPLTAINVSSAGRIVASGNAGGSLRLWLASSSRLQRLYRAHHGQVTSLAFSPNDRLLASAGEDGQIKVWDLRSGRTPRVLRGNGGPVLSVAFSSDGRRVMSAGQDGTIRAWSLASAAAGY